MSILEKDKGTYEFRVQVTGDAVHPGTVLDDPVKEVCQGEEVAPRLAVDTDGCRARAATATQLHTQQHHEQSPHWKREGEREKDEDDEINREEVEGVEREEGNRGRGQDPLTSQEQH